MVSDFRQTADYSRTNLRAFTRAVYRPTQEDRAELEASRTPILETLYRMSRGVKVFDSEHKERVHYPNGGIEKRLERMRKKAGESGLNDQLKLKVNSQGLIQIFFQGKLYP